MIAPFEKVKKLIEWLTPEERWWIRDKLDSYPPLSKEEVKQLRMNGWKISDIWQDEKKYNEAREFFRRDLERMMNREQ